MRAIRTCAAAGSRTIIDGLIANRRRDINLTFEKVCAAIARTLTLAARRIATSFFTIARFTAVDVVVAQRYCHTLTSI